MSDEMTVRIDSEDYLVRPEGGTLKVGRQVGGDTVWLDDVDLGTLAEDARSALERGDSSDPALAVALRGIVAAEVQRGG
jgi:hypothetical protein